MASSSHDLHLLTERFAAKCEAAGKRMSTSKSETMVQFNSILILFLQRAIIDGYRGGKEVPYMNKETKKLKKIKIKRLNLHGNISAPVFVQLTRE